MSCAPNCAWLIDSLLLQARVEALGGQILFWNGVRVMGVLAVSRAIGDHCLRPFVIAQPEVCAPALRLVWALALGQLDKVPASSAGLTMTVPAWSHFPPCNAHLQAAIWHSCLAVHVNIWPACL